MMDVYWAEFANRPQAKRGAPKMPAEYFQQRYAQQIAEYLAGASTVGIAEMYGEYAQFWARRFRRAGVKLRPRNGPHAKPGAPKGFRREFIARNEEIVAMRLAGASLQAIATRYDMTRERVRQIVRRANPVYAETGKQMRARLCKVETQQRRMRPCAACGKPFSVPFKNQRHCSYVCGAAAWKIDEQKHRDALAMREQGCSWRRIGLDVYGFNAESQPGCQAQRTLTRWAKRTGYDLSRLVNVGIHADKDHQ